MPARSTIVTWLLLAALAAAVPASAAEPSDRETSPALRLRVVQLPGPLDRADLAHHVEWLDARGFNAVWVRAHQLTADPLADPAEFRTAAHALVRACRERDVRVFVSVSPALLLADRYAYSDAELVDALRTFARRLRRELRVADLVLSFADAPERLTEIRDVFAYGRRAAEAHVDLTRRLQRKLGRGTRLWYRPTGLFAGELPAAVGLVWEGSGQPAARVEAQELDRLRVATGERPTLLLDRYPANQAGRLLPLSHNLGPLRDRDPALATRLDGHVSVAMEDWGASRLTLATVADWLRDPRGYEPGHSWERAMKRLAGDDAEALEALRTQALEWGGPIGGLNHHTARTDNPTEAAAVLRDPALAARWKWTLARYPERMAALAGLGDDAFRAELLEMMARRLAVARAIPTTREILARQTAGRGDLGALIAELNRLRASARPRSARLALDRFLSVAGLISLLDRAEDSPGRPD